MEIKILFTILAAVCGTIGFVPYLWTSLFGRTRPHVFTWLIWAITNGVAVAGLWYGGGGVGAIAPTIAAVFAALIFLVSLRFGRRDIKKSDVVVLIIALSSILIWLLLDKPLLAVLIVSGVDIIGYVPTFRKSFNEPWTEALPSWALFAGASIFAILALEEYNLLTVSYLGSISFINSALLLYLFIRRKAVKKGLK